MNVRNRQGHIFCASDYLGGPNRADSVLGRRCQPKESAVPAQFVASDCKPKKPSSTRARDDDEGKARFEPQVKKCVPEARVGDSIPDAAYNWATVPIAVAATCRAVRYHGKPGTYFEARLLSGMSDILDPRSVYT